MGMPEYRDGSFGEIKPIKQAVQDLMGSDGVELERTKALHIGRIEELTQRRAESVVGFAEGIGVSRVEFDQLRMDVNKILIHLGIDDKSTVLPVRSFPQGKVHLKE